MAVGGGFGIVAVNADAVALGFTRDARKLDANAGKVVRHHAHLLRTKIMARASGRPGPNAPTGDYRRSWAVEIVNAPGMVIGYVGTNAPQGRRLEFGFYGADSLGRVYAQPPYPHVGPAFDQASPDFVKAIEKMVGELG